MNLFAKTIAVSMEHATMPRKRANVIPGGPEMIAGHLHVKEGVVPMEPVIPNPPPAFVSLGGGVLTVVYLMTP